MDDEKAGARQRAKDAARDKIIDAALSLIADGAELNHDLIADRADLSRRTVYRYFPDRDELMRSVWEAVVERAGPRVGFPQSEEEFLDRIPAIFDGFDDNADVITLLRSTPQGRAVRLSQRDQRVAAYSKALEHATSRLPEPDRRLAIALMQALHTSLWLEMRDQWELSGAQIASVSLWAARVLLGDLHRRGSLPLDAGPADQRRSGYELS